MYIRFVTYKIDEDSGRRQGVFQAAADLLETGTLSLEERERLDALWKRFKKDLKKPSSFSRSKKPCAAHRALSWFKDTAKDHIAAIYGMVAILEAHGIAVEVIRTQRPGYITYEDDHQVTAEPYADTDT
jgi:hypothetical protein